MKHMLCSAVALFFPFFFDTTRRTEVIKVRSGLEF